MNERYNAIEEFQTSEWGGYSKIGEVVSLYHQERIRDNQMYENKNSLTQPMYENKNSLTDFNRNL